VGEALIGPPLPNTKRLSMGMVDMQFSNYLLKRMLLLVVVLIGASILSFLLVRIAPGDPARMLLPPQASPEDIARMRTQMGLDRPYHEQYLMYMTNLIHGDLGFSHHTGRPVLEEFRMRLPATIELSVLSLGLATVVGIWLGVMSALNKDKFIDHAARVVSIAGISAPSFWIGLLAIFAFYYLLGWAPAPTGRVDVMVKSVQSITGLMLVDSALTRNWVLFRDALSHLALPVLVLSFSFLAMICRLTRAGMLEVMEQDYIKFAQCCGISRSRVVWRYALRNAVRPVITMLGLFVAQLLGGVVFVETVFNWPGIGRYAVESLWYLDYTPIQGFIIFMAIIYVVMNLAIDLLYMALDPRVQY